MNLGFNTMPSAEQKKAYESTMKIFDIAEEIIDITEKYDPEVTAPYVKDLTEALKTIEESTEEMLENFLNCVKKDKKVSGIEKIKMEKAFKRANEAIEKIKQRVKEIEGVN